jgi:hypothetical protein
MNIPDGHLVRKAFLTKYGYPPDLTTRPRLLRRPYIFSNRAAAASAASNVTNGRWWRTASSR